MKFILLIIGALLLGSGVYFYTVPSAENRESVAATAPAVLVENVETTQCTSTACMKNESKSETIDSSRVILEKNTGDTEVSAPTTKEIIKEVIKKVLPENKPTPSSTATQIQYTDFVNPDGFVNSEPFKLADYIGKRVILVEFITYSCINCQRTFPFMKQMYSTYERDGLLVVGIHTPEFAYEKDRDNVIEAMKKEGIIFPIVLDNEYQTWNAYANRFWPHRYVIDYTGAVVFDHVGEGAYIETESIIKSLLANKPKDV